MTRSLLVFAAMAACTAAGCGRRSHAPAEQAATANASPAASSAEAALYATARPEKLAARHLANVWRITDKVLSGGQPADEAAFQELADLGVKTVISVDGMKPDAETALKHGLRYVHLPHGYDGIPEERAQELAKAVRDLPGPIYIHCHHGQHRSPSAAAVACVGAGLLDRSLAERVLTLAGTSENYQGLYASARAAQPFDAALLDALEAEFSAASAVPPLAEAMVALEQTHDHLQQIAAAGWKSPPAHPDLEPAHKALLLREHFAELLRMDEVTQRPEAFLQSLRESETAAQSLEGALRARPMSTEAAQASLDRVGQRCAACHQEYRDQPLSEQRRADFQVRPAP